MPSSSPLGMSNSDAVCERCGITVPESKAFTEYTDGELTINLTFNRVKDRLIGEKVDFLCKSCVMEIVKND